MASPEADAGVITLQGIGKSFSNGVEALAGIELAVAPGDFLTLLGPSGCGKSTLLRIIAGLVEPSCGRILHRDDLLRRVGFVFQEPTLMPWATAWDNVYLPLKLARERRRGAAPRVSQALESVGLGGFANAYPRQLSGGMRMRVSIARALVTDPQLLLLDEPFAALDEFTRFRLNEDLLTLWQARRCTVVFVTHSVFEAVFLSSRIIIMTPRPGRIVADCAIDLPYPRVRELRTSPEYAAYCRRISAHLDRTA
jgi:NitT/TauT family transport system ATP-binding protein